MFLGQKSAPTALPQSNRIHQARTCMYVRIITQRAQCCTASLDRQIANDLSPTPSRVVIRCVWSFAVAGRACERSGQRSGAGRKSGGAERSVEREWQKTMERERSAEREVAGREQSGEPAS